MRAEKDFTEEDLKFYSEKELTFLKHLREVHHLIRENIGSNSVYWEAFHKEIHLRESQQHPE